MATTSAKMGLRIWNLLTDLYDHAQLADNWAKVDYHDHSPGRGVQIPTEGLADGAVTGTKLATTLDPTSAYTTYKLLAKGAGAMQFVTANVALFAGANIFTVTGADSARAALHLDPADHSVPGRTAKLRIVGTYVTNAVAPANTLTLGLYPVATWGGASAAAPTIATVGSVVTGSTISFVTQLASTAAYNVSADFDVPSVGWYALGALPNSNAAANSLQTVEMQLQVHYI